MRICPLSLCKVAGLQLNSWDNPHCVVLNELASNLPPTLAEYKARLENRIEKKILIYLSDFQANIAVVIYTLSKSLPHCDLINLNSHITDWYILIQLAERMKRNFKKTRRNTCLLDFLVFFLFVVFISQVHFNLQSGFSFYFGERKKKRLIAGYVYLRYTFKNRKVKAPINQSEVTSPLISR